MKCETCGHTKSRHNKQKCTSSQCSCKKFRKEKERPTGDPTLEKIIKESVEIKIDGKKLLDKFNEFAEKSSKKQDRRSEVEDSMEKIFTEISELGSDYKQRIIECEKVIKNREVSERKRIEALIEKGISLRRDGRAAESLQSFGDVLLMDEKNISALREKAYSYRVLDNFLEAINCYKDWLDIDGKNVDALNRIAMCYANRKLAKYDEAINWLRQVLAIDEKNILAIDNMGMCYQMKEEYKTALVYFKKSGSDYALDSMVEIYYYTHDNDAAFDLGNKLIKDGKTSAYHYYVVGDILYDRKKYDEAIPFLKKSLSLGEDALHILGLCYQRKERFDLAILYYEKELDETRMDDHDYPITKTNLGMCYFGIKEYKIALKHFKTASLTDPKYLSAFYWKLKTYDNLGRYEEIVKDCEKHPEFLVDMGVLRNKQYALFELARYPEALECSKKILETVLPKSSTWHKSASDFVWGGWILKKLGDIEGAKKRYAKAIETDKENEQGYRYMGLALMDDGDFKGAKDYFKKAWDISKDDEMILAQGNAVKKMGGLLDAKKHDEINKEAESIFDSILESTEFSGEAWLEKGNCNWNLGKKGLAEDYYLKACKIIPKDPKVWINLGDVAMSNDSATEALMFYEKSLLYDESSDAYFGKGRAYKSLKQWSLAIEYYDKALKLDEHNEHALFGKAKCYGASKKYRKSIDCYATFIQKFGKSTNIVRAYAHKAWAENRLENYDKALDSCHKAIEIANMKTPASDNIVDARGKVFLPSDKKTIEKEKLEVMQFVFQERGIAFQGLEQYDEAIKCFKKLKADKNYTFPLIRIIECLGKLGRIEEQKEYRRKLNKLEDDET